MLNIKVLGALVACALIVAVPSLAHGGPVVGHPLAKGTMQATTINAQAGSMIFEIGTPPWPKESVSRALNCLPPTASAMLGISVASPSRFSTARN